MYAAQMQHTHSKPPPPPATNGSQLMFVVPVTLTPVLTCVYSAVETRESWYPSSTPNERIVDSSPPSIRSNGAVYLRDARDGCDPSVV